FPIRVDERSIGCEGGLDIDERGEGLPCDGERRQFQPLERFGFAHNRGHGFTSEPGLDFGKRGLVGEAANYAITIFAGNIPGGEHTYDSRVRGHKGIKIAEAETGSRMRTADRLYNERSGGNFVGAENFRAIYFSLSVEAHQPLPHSASGSGR